MLRHLSHLLVAFMLYEFSLFILCGTSDVWLDLQMPPRASGRNVNCCVMEMLHFATFCTLHSGTAMADMIFVHSPADWWSFSLGSLKWNWSSHAQVKWQTHSSLRSSLSHPTDYFQTSPRTHTHTHFNFLFSSLFSFSPLSTSAFAMWGMYDCFPLLCVQYFDKTQLFLSFIFRSPPGGCWDLEKRRERESGEYLTEVGLHWLFWTQRVVRESLAKLTTQ